VFFHWADMAFKKMSKDERYLCSIMQITNFSIVKIQKDLEVVKID